MVLKSFIKNKKEKIAAEQAYHAVCVSVIEVRKKVNEIKLNFD